MQEPQAGDSYKLSYPGTEIAITFVKVLAVSPTTIIVWDGDKAENVSRDVFPMVYDRVGLANGRDSWDTYFTKMAHLVATRATCDRKHVGAVIVADRHIVSTGYNGSPPGLPHCDEVGHDLVTLADGSVNCVRTTHAEHNAILQAAKLGMRLANSTLYVNTFPCWACSKAILGAGIQRVVYDDEYREDPRVRAAFETKNVMFERYKNP
jgi:dCMP deaminase